VGNRIKGGLPKASDRCGAAVFLLATLQRSLDDASGSPELAVFEPRSAHSRDRKLEDATLTLFYWEHRIFWISAFTGMSERMGRWFDGDRDF